MLDDALYSKFRRQLVERRKEILDNREAINSSWQALNDPEVELEESASKKTMSDSLAHLDAQSYEEVRLIDNALSKIKKGSYGKCEICNTPISPKRLYAMPHARHCIHCARSRQPFSKGDVDEATVKLNSTGIPDDEMEEAIYDAVDDEKDLDISELEIRCEKGVVYLEGIVASATTIDVLHQIIQDQLGFSQIVDNLTVDILPGENQENSETADFEKKETDELLEGESGGVDPYESLETNEPMTPPDTMERE